MSYFYGKQKRYKLTDLKADTFAIAVFSNNVFFLEFSSIRAMYQWYKCIPSKTCHEIIRHAPRKLVLDVDGDCSIDLITKCLIRIFGDDANIVLYQSHGPVKTSWHIVVSNYYFKDHHYCKYVASLIPAKNIDMAVYSSTQFLRMEGSHKNGRTKVRDGYHALTSLEIFREGLVSCIDNAVEMVIKLPKAPVLDVSSSSNIDYDKTAFRIRSQKGDAIFFDRIRPSYCTICKRIHDSENIAIINGKLICWRKMDTNSR
jgi:hypothetical protein